MNNNLYISTFTYDNFNYFIGVTNKGLAYLLRDNEFENKYSFNLIEDNNKTRLYKEQLIKYFNKELKEFDFKIDLNGTDFQIKVWKELIKIPYGKTFSYLDIANKLNSPNSVRAVANAIGKNNILIVLPCHRIIGSNKKLTGFSSGLDMKEYLLNLENIFDYKR